MSRTPMVQSNVRERSRISSSHRNGSHGHLEDSAFSSKHAASTRNSLQQPDYSTYSLSKSLGSKEQISASRTPIVSRLDLSDLQDDDDVFNRTFTNESNCYGKLSATGCKTEIVMSLRQTNVLLSPRVYDTVVLGDTGPTMRGLETSNGRINGSMKKQHLQQVTLGPVETDTLCGIMLSPRENDNIYGFNGRHVDSSHPVGLQSSRTSFSIKRSPRLRPSYENSQRKNLLTKPKDHKGIASRMSRNTLVQPRTQPSFLHSTPLSKSRTKSMPHRSRKHPPSVEAATVNAPSNILHKDSRHQAKGTKNSSILSFSLDNTQRSTTNGPTISSFSTNGTGDPVNPSHLHHYETRDPSNGLYDRESFYPRARGDYFSSAHELADDLAEADIEHLITQRLLKNIDEKCQAMSTEATPSSYGIQSSKKHATYPSGSLLRSDHAAPMDTTQYLSDVSEPLQISELQSDIRIEHTRGLYLPQYCTSVSDSSDGYDEYNYNIKVTSNHSNSNQQLSSSAQADRLALHDNTLHKFHDSSPMTHDSSSMTHPSPPMPSTCHQSQFSHSPRRLEKPILKTMHIGSSEDYLHNENYNAGRLPHMDYNTISQQSSQHTDTLYNTHSINSRKQVHFKEPISTSDKTATDPMSLSFSSESEPLLTLHDLGMPDQGLLGKNISHKDYPRIFNDQFSKHSFDGNTMSSTEPSVVPTTRPKKASSSLPSGKEHNNKPLQQVPPPPPFSDHLKLANPSNRASHPPQTLIRRHDREDSHPPAVSKPCQDNLRLLKSSLPSDSNKSSKLLPTTNTSFNKPQSHYLQAKNHSSNKVYVEAQEKAKTHDHREQADLTLALNADTDAETLRIVRLQRLVDQSPPNQQQNIVLKARYFRRWYRNVRVKKLVKSKWNFKWMKACSCNRISTLSQHFIAWRQHIVNCRVKADEFHRKHSLRKGFHALKWSVQYRLMKNQQVHLSQRRLKFKHYFTLWNKRYSKRRLDTLRSKFSRWRIRCRNKVIFDIFKHKRDRLSMLQIFFFWHERLKDSLNVQKAVNHHKTVTARRYWHLWRIYTAERIVQSSQLEVAQLKHDSWVLSTCMGRWKKSFIQMQYARIYYNKKISTISMKQWRNETSVLRVQHRKEKAAAYEIRRKSLVQTHFTRWKEEIKVKGMKKRISTTYLMYCFSIWKSQLHKHKILSAEISVLHQKHLLKRTFAVLKIYSEYKKENRRHAVAHIERFALMRSLSGWHKFTMRKVKLRNKQKTFSFNRMKIHIRQLFYNWSSKLSVVFELQKMQREWTRCCVRSAADKWLLVLRRKQQVKLSDEVVAEQKKSLLRDCFGNWKLQFSREQKLKDRALCYKISLLRGKLRRMIRSWHLHTQNVITVRPLVERIKRKRITKFFDAWKLLVTRRNQQEMMKQTVQTGRMRNCFVSWRERLNVKMKLLNAGERYDANLQLKVIKSWTKIVNRRHSYDMVSEQHQQSLLKTSFEIWSKQTSLKRIALMSEMEEHYIIHDTARALLLRWRAMSMNAKTRDQDKVISFKQGRDLITKRSKFRIWMDAFHHHHAAENFNAIKTRQRLKVFLLSWNVLSRENLKNETQRFTRSIEKLSQSSKSSSKSSMSRSTQSNNTHYTDVPTQTHDIQTLIPKSIRAPTYIEEQDAKSILHTNSTPKKYSSTAESREDPSLSHPSEGFSENEEIDSEQESGLTIGGDSGVSLFRDYVSMATSADYNEGVQKYSMQQGQCLPSSYQINIVDDSSNTDDSDHRKLLLERNSKQNSSIQNPNSNPEALSESLLQQSSQITDENILDLASSCHDITHMHDIESLPEHTNDPFLQPILQQFSHMSNLPIHDIIVPMHAILHKRQVQDVSMDRWDMKYQHMHVHESACMPQDIHKPTDALVQGSVYRGDHYTQDSGLYSSPGVCEYGNQNIGPAVQTKEEKLSYAKENKFANGAQHEGLSPCEVYSETTQEEEQNIERESDIAEEDAHHSNPNDEQSIISITDDKNTSLQNSDSILCSISQSSPEEAFSSSHPLASTSPSPPHHPLAKTSPYPPKNEDHDIQKHPHFIHDLSIEENMNSFTQEDLYTGMHDTHLTKSELLTSSLCGVVRSQDDEDILFQTDDITSSNDDVIWELPYNKQKPFLPVHTSFKDSGMSQTEWLVRLAVIRMRYRPLAFSFHQWKMLIHVKKWEKEMLSHMTERSKFLKLKLAFRFWKVKFHQRNTAKEHQRSSLTQKYFRRWLFVISRKLHLKRMKDLALKFLISSMQKKYFLDWKRKTEKRRALLEILSYWQSKAHDRNLLIHKDRKKQEKSDSALLHEYFVIWSLRHRQCKMAEHHYKSKEMNKIFSLWFAWSTEQREFRDHLKKLHNQSLKKQVFAAWRHNIAITKRMTEIKRRFLRLWISSLIERWHNYTEEQQRFVGEISRFATESYVKSKRNCFEKWKEELMKKKLSGVMYRRCYMKKFIQAWHDVTTEVVEERTRFEAVENLVATHTKQSVFTIWKKETSMQAEVQRIIYEKYVLLVKGCWNEWRTRLNMKKAVRLQSALLNRRVFFAWRKCTEKQKKWNHKAKLVLVKWHEITVRNQTLSRMADQYRLTAHSISTEIYFNMWLIAYEQSQRACLHYNKRILQRSFTSLYFWTKHKRVLRKAKIQFINQRRKELFASAWYKWKYLYQLRVCNSYAIQAHQRAVSHRLLWRSWLVWKQRVTEFRASKNHDTNVLLKAFHSWNEKYRNRRRADRLMKRHQDNKMKQIIKGWHRLQMTKKKEKKVVDNILSSRQNMVTLSIFSIWLKRTRNVITAKSYWKTMTMHKVIMRLKAWREKSKIYNNAVNALSKLKLKIFFTKWKLMYRKTRMLEITCNHLLEVKSQVLLKSSWKCWFKRKEKRDLVEMRERNLARDVAKKWRAYSSNRVRKRELKKERIVAWREFRRKWICRRLFRRWENEFKINQFFSTNEKINLSKAWSKWTRNTAINVFAVDFNKDWTLRRFWNQWRVEHVTKKATNEITDQFKHDQLKNVFILWRSFTNRKRMREKWFLEKQLAHEMAARKQSKIPRLRK